MGLGSVTISKAVFNLTPGSSQAVTVMAATAVPMFGILSFRLCLDMALSFYLWWAVDMSPNLIPLLLSTSPSRPLVHSHLFDITNSPVKQLFLSQKPLATTVPQLGLGILLHAQVLCKMS